MTLVEICVEDLEGISIASRSGADRVEWCADLSCGGLTPDVADLEEALDRAPRGGLQVLVRPRAGGFCYSSEEITQMCDEIEEMRSRPSGDGPPLGFVVGALSQDATVDLPALMALRRAAGKSPLTFHRAFDCVDDRDAALEELVRIGYDRVLTTGGDPARARLGELAHLVERAHGRICILASGGLRATTVREAVRCTGVTEVHMRAPLHGGMPPGGREQTMRTSTDAALVREIVEALRVPLV